MALGAFAEITETPGVGATHEQLRMLSTRYEFAARSVRGKRVLEVACGTGIGLGYLKSSGATEVVGCDIDPLNVATATATYAGRSGIVVCQDDAQTLANISGAFDVVLCFEAIYYFADLQSFLTSCRRRLLPGGSLILCSVNPRWSGFSVSAHASRYWAPGELSAELDKAGFKSRFYGGFRDVANGFKAQLISGVRKMAVRLGLLPKSMRGKVLLKRIFLGGTEPMPRELDLNKAPPSEPLHVFSIGDPIPFKVFYAESTRS